MKKLSDFYESLSTAGKIAMFVCFICIGGPIGLILIAVIASKGASDRFNNVLNNPTEENVVIFMEKMNGIHNHPDSWSRYRGLWNVVNRSNRVTTPTKEKFLAKLMACGLHMNNTRINNNYKGSYAHDNPMQEEMNRQFHEWSMEESRKAATPFDHGGYVQGDGFNPSDTMAADAQRQMDNMNQMNHTGML